MKRMSNFEKSLDKFPFLVYNGGNTINDGGDIVNSKEMLEAALNAVGVTKANAAAKVGWAPPQLSAKLTRGSLKADEFLEILDGLGVDLNMTVRKTGDEIKVRIRGAGRKVRLMVDKVVYDTSLSSALANNFYADGINKYTDGKALELYVDKENRYFFAEYSDWEGTKDRITPVNAETAAAFIEKYGTDLHREPKSDSTDE